MTICGNSWDFLVPIRGRRNRLRTFFVSLRNHAEPRTGLCNQLTLAYVTGNRATQPTHVTMRNQEPGCVTGNRAA